MTLFDLASSLPESRRASGGSIWSAVAVIAATIVIANLASVANGLRGSKSRDDIAMLVARKYADAAFPSFRAAHPDRSCPASLAELNEWMNSKTTNDPWGTPFAMECTLTPAHRHAIVVRSAGEDAKFGTADDLRSDE